MNKINRFEVTNYPNPTTGFWGKVLLFLGLRKAPETFDIYINADFKRNDIISTAGDQKYIVIKQYL